MRSQGRASAPGQTAASTQGPGGRAPARARAYSGARTATPTRGSGRLMRSTARGSAALRTATSAVLSLLVSATPAPMQATWP